MRSADGIPDWRKKQYFEERLNIAVAKQLEYMAESSRTWSLHLVGMYTEMVSRACVLRFVVRWRLALAQPAGGYHNQWQLLRAAAVTSVLLKYDGIFAMCVLLWGCCDRHRKCEIGLDDMNMQRSALRRRLKLSSTTSVPRSDLEMNQKRSKQTSHGLRDNCKPWGMNCPLLSTMNLRC